MPRPGERSCFRPGDSTGGTDAPNEYLAQLRREFPHWAILPGHRGTWWIAVRGKTLTIHALNGIELRDKLQLATRHPNSGAHC